MNKSHSPTLSLSYFGYFFVLSLEFTYLPSYFWEIAKFSGKDIGWIYAGITVVNMIAQPFWGQIVDKTQMTSRILRYCALGGLAAFIPILFYQGFLWVLGFIWISAFFLSAIPSLLDILTLRRAGMESYGKIRVWGSIAYGAAALVFPAQMLSLVLPVIAFCLFFCYLAFFSLGRDSEIPSGHEETRFCLHLLKNPCFLLLTVFGILHWCSSTPYNLILDVHRREMSLPSYITGCAITAGVTAECLVLVISHKWLPKACARHWLMLCASFTALRWSWMSYPLSSFCMVVVQVIHGLSYGVFFVASISYLLATVPESMRASGQTLFCGLSFGGGNILGSLYAGVLLDSQGRGFYVFGLAACISLLSLIAALFIPAPKTQEK
jgi:PPP family 3-phenylpropionic acid transporter